VSPLLIALLGVLIVPLFIATWRTSLYGLGAQGVLMGLVAWRLGHGAADASAWLTLADLVLVRGLVVPAALYDVQSSANVPARHDVIAPNLLSWTVALGMVLVSFGFAELLVPEPGDQRTLVAVTTAGVLLGFLVLASQSSPFGQMVGALRIENSIALLELGGARHEPPLFLQLALLAVFIGTVGYFRWSLKGLHEVAAQKVAETVEGPTL
jgi:hydrogenase-4 membrane subunit HyfE